MKNHWKLALLILLLTGCAAYYKPQDSNWIIQVW